jgi:hypothetical protein
MNIEIRLRTSPFWDSQASHGQVWIGAHSAGQPPCFEYVLFLYLSTYLEQVDIDVYTTIVRDDMAGVRKHLGKEWRKPLGNEVSAQLPGYA